MRLRALLNAAVPLFATAVCAQQPQHEQHALTLSEPYSHAAAPPSSFRIASLSRTLELGGAVARAQLVYTLDGSGGALNDFVFSLDDADINGGRLSWLEASSGKTSASKRKLAVRGLGYDRGRHAYFYAANIPSTASTGSEQITITVSTVYTHASRPMPATIAQDARIQGMYWQGDLLGGALRSLRDGEQLASGDVKARVKSPSPRSTAEVTPSSFTSSHPTGSSTITFTSSTALFYEPTLTSTGAASQIDTLAGVHYEQPEPVVSYRRLERTAFVSHWGNHLAVQDDVELVNNGPKLKGFFSRLTHQAIAYMRRQGQVVPHTVNSITLLLPPNVHSPFFIDEVGNVSTSRFRPSAPKGAGTTSLSGGASVLELIPRYPLMGGWNYTFSYGYKQPLSMVLRRDPKKSSRHSLSVPFLIPLKDAAINDATLRVVLPEGASGITVATPFPIDSLEYSTTYSYLDTVGRPTVILRKTGCSDKHAVDIVIGYDYSTLKLMRKPIAVAAALLGVFSLTGTLTRLSWSLKA